MSAGRRRSEDDSRSQLPARDITIRAGLRDFYREQFARFGLNFDRCRTIPTSW
jgi:hypothetical protein